MGLFNWGALPKAQDNAQTIDEAITAGIAAHESDPTAHLGVGESLQQHKNNEVIDHPSQSIVIDKQAYNIYDEISTILGGYDWSNEVGTTTHTGHRDMSLSLFSQSAVNAYTILPFGGAFPYPVADLLFTFHLYVNGMQSINGQAKLFLSYDNDPANTTRIEFVKDGISLYFRIYVSGTKVHEYLLKTGGYYDHFVGVFYDSLNDLITLSVDGVDVSSYYTLNWHDLIFNSLAIDASRTTNTSIQFQIFNWKARYQLY